MHFLRGLFGFIVSLEIFFFLQVKLRIYFTKAELMINL